MIYPASLLFLLIFSDPLKIKKLRPALKRAQVYYKEKNEKMN